MTDREAIARVQAWMAMGWTQDEAERWVLAEWHAERAIEAARWAITAPQSAHCAPGAQTPDAPPGSPAEAPALRRVCGMLRGA